MICLSHTFIPLLQLLLIEMRGFLEFLQLGGGELRLPERPVNTLV